MLLTHVNLIDKLLNYSSTSGDVGVFPLTSTVSPVCLPVRVCVHCLSLQLCLATTCRGISKPVRVGLVSSGVLCGVCLQLVVLFCFAVSFNTRLPHHPTKVTILAMWWHG